MTYKMLMAQRVTTNRGMLFRVAKWIENSISDPTAAP
jgi:hypothetical protein